MTEQIEGILHFDGRIREGDISASLLHILGFFYRYITVPCEKTCACIVCALVVYLNILRVTEEMLCLQILYY